MTDRQTAAVIIPTTGRATLRRAVQSVLAQTHPDTVAVIVVDGPQFGPATIESLDGLLPHPRIQLMPLPQNTGANGYQGHRIYGSVPQLVNQDWIFWLDDDNWFEPDHVAECVGSCVEHGLSWCATLRNIYEPGGAFLCVDECESLAVVPTWFNPSSHHVDTSCFCLSREVAVQLAMHWHRPHLPFDTDPAKYVSPDTSICQVLRQDAPCYALIARATVNYTLGSRDITPKPEFFTKGNIVMRKRHGGKLPWEAWPATTKAVGFHSSAERWDQCLLSIESFHEHHGTEDLAYYLLWMGYPEQVVKTEFPDYLRILTWNDFDPVYREKLCGHGPMSGYPRPLMIRHMQERHERVMFVDADMMTYAPMHDLYDKLKTHDALVTPHRLTPAPRDGKRLQMEHFALFGNYNSGFTAWSNSPEAKAFVDWYLAISLEADEQAPQYGRYSEQGWLRFVGDFLDKAHVLRDPGVNVAWWRIDSPDQIKKQFDGQWIVDGVPLRLFHFSGIDFDDLGPINIHQERVRGSGDLLKLYEEYRDAVMKIRRSIVLGDTPGKEHADAGTTD
jgi:glycosyltransferase involved in cell wall biosynthesis